MACALVLGTLLGGAQAHGTPLLLGGGGPDVRAGRELDPLLPTGALRPAVPRPEAAEPPACSRRRPVCVHRGPSVAAEQALEALGSLERAYEELVLSMGLPAPLPDAGRGSSDALDLYLVSELTEDFASHGEEVPGLGLGRSFDHASVFCVAKPASPAALRRAGAHCVGEAIAQRLDASLTPHHRRAFASWLRWVVAGPDDEDQVAIRRVLDHPERALFARDLTARSEGAALAFEYLDARLARGRQSLLPVTLVALAASKTAAHKLQFNNEPDIMDVLRESAKSREDHAQTLGELGVELALLGTKASRLERLAWVANVGTAKVDWELTSSSLPRRVAATRPIEPTGSWLVRLELDDLRGADTLGLRVDWEPPASFFVTVLKLARDGTLVGRLKLPYLERGTSIEQRVTNLEGTHALLIVLTNLGGVSPTHPFDPDQAPYEPHRATLYVARLTAP